MLIPLGHSEAVVRKMPWVTIAIAVICFLVQIWATTADVGVDDLVDEYVGLYTEVIEEFGDPENPDSGPNQLVWQSFEEGELTDEDDPLFERYQSLEARAKEARNSGPVGKGGYAPASSPLWKALTCMFVHGGWWHLIGNMYFLYLVGCNIEDRWTRGGFLIFYLLGGLVATGTYAAMHPNSEVVLVGASGAISAVMGAFLIVMGRSQIVFFYFWWFFFRIFTGTFRAPAWIALLMYFVMDLISMLGESGSGGGVAYSAHVGGFIFGLLVGAVLHATGWDKTLSEKGDDVIFERSKQALDATTLVGTDPDAALAQLRAAVAAQPNDLGAHDQLVDWFATLPLSPRLQTEFDFYVQAETRAGRDARVLQTFARMRQREDFVPSDRAMLGVSQAAARIGDNDFAVDVVRELMRDHPRSPLIPRAMWDVSQIQVGAGMHELAQETRRALVERFPDDPFAARARELLDA